MEKPNEWIEKIQEVQNAIEEVNERYLSETLATAITSEVMLALLALGVLEEGK